MIGSEKCLDSRAGRDATRIREGMSHAGSGRGFSISHVAWREPFDTSPNGFDPARVASGTHTTAKPWRRPSAATPGESSTSTEMPKAGGYFDRDEIGVL